MSDVANLNFDYGVSCYSSHYTTEEYVGAPKSFLHMLHITAPVILLPSRIRSEIISFRPGSIHLPEVEILKVGHHGSRVAASEDFLSIVSPEVAQRHNIEHNPDSPVLWGKAEYLNENMEDKSPPQMKLL